MGDRERGLISGGDAARDASFGSTGGSAAASAARFFSAIISTVFRNSWSATGLEGSIACALWNSPAAPWRSPCFRSSTPCLTCNSLASKRIRFRFLTLVVARLALRAARDEQSETNTQE